MWMKIPANKWDLKQKTAKQHDWHATRFIATNSLSSHEDKVQTKRSLTQVALTCSVVNKLTWSWSMSQSPVMTMRFSILVSDRPPFSVCSGANSHVKTRLCWTAAAWQSWACVRLYLGNVRGCSSTKRFRGDCLSSHQHSRLPVTVTIQLRDITDNELGVQNKVCNVCVPNNSSPAGGGINLGDVQSLERLDLILYLKQIVSQKNKTNR